MDILTLSWKTQSWTWNWIQAAASKFKVVAGLNSPGFLDMKASLTSLGFGVQSSFSVGFSQYFLGKLRPKRIPEQPIFGMVSELSLPSEFLAERKRLSSKGVSSVLPCAVADVYPSWRFYWRNSTRKASRLSAPKMLGSLCHGTNRFTKWNKETRVLSRKPGRKFGVGGSMLESLMWVWWLMTEKLGSFDWFEGRLEIGHGG